MKNLLLLIIVFTAVTAKAQTPYTTEVDTGHPGGKILNGIVTKYALSNDTAFKWYAMNKNAYKPDSSILNTMEAAKGKFQFVLFGGSWCEDTQFILPKFFMLQEMAGLADKDISFFAVDRAKQTIGGITSSFKITNVPTIIVMKDGKEVGRVVEYGKTGKWDKELSDLMK